MKMKKTPISIRSIALLMALVLVVGIAFVVPSRAADTADLGKIVDYFLANSTSFTLNANSRFFLESEPTGELLQTIQLAQRQFAADGIPTAKPMDIVWGKTEMLRAGDIYITMVDNDANIGAEGYKIVAESYATVIAEDVDGLLYGLNMLQKHFRNGGTNTIKGFTTYDTPDTKERTVQLDCARKYLTVDYICNFVKEMSWMGYNTLQLHFSEDSGFRMDFWDPTYYVDYNDDGTAYNPANDFSWICGGHPTTWTHTSSLTGINYADYEDKDKYLKMDEIIQILETCKEYHIDVLPSFDTPSHVDYLTWRYEQYYNNGANKFSFKSTYDGKTYNASDVNGCINYSEATGYAKPQWPYYTCIDLDSAQAVAFAMELYIDIANFFKEFGGSTKFNIGCDEPNLTNSAIRAKAWSYTKFPAYVNDLYDLLSGKGYSVRMFNDFINSNALNGVEDQMEALNPNIQILYWNSPFSTLSNKTGANENYQVNYMSNGSIVNDPMLSVSDYVNKGRVLFNCINQHTYYVLRINDSEGDARSKTCHQWEFYGANEESIYNDWTPNNIRKKGVYTEGDSIVPTSQLGGAYFLTWHDYAAVNTENEIWNGVTDDALKTGEFYSLRNRMWSNTIKMWNHDVNVSLTFEKFSLIRETMGDFPGLQDDTYPDDSSYAKATSLPAATAPIQLADHTALTAALANKLAKGSYTDESYAVYEDAYNNAILINNKNNATSEELGQALADLIAAQEALVIRTNTVSVVRKTSLNGTEYVIDTLKYSIPSGESNFEVFVPALNGYKYLKTDGATFVTATAADDSGYLSGTITGDKTVSMWYENQVDVSRLNNLLDDAITKQGDFTDDSWRVYSAALNAARNFTLTLDTQQATVLALVKALEDARTALVVQSDTTFIKVEKLAESYNKGGQIGLHIRTSANVPGLAITKDGVLVTPDSISAEVQELTNGDIVKYWLVFLDADAAGTFTYTITYATTSTEITVTVV